MDIQNKMAKILPEIKIILLCLLYTSKKGRDNFSPDTK